MTFGDIPNIERPSTFKINVQVANDANIVIIYSFGEGITSRTWRNFANACRAQTNAKISFSAGNSIYTDFDQDDHMIFRVTKFGDGEVKSRIDVRLPIDMGIQAIEDAALELELYERRVGQS